MLGTDDDTVIREFEKMRTAASHKGDEGAYERERMIPQMRYGIEHEELTQKDIARKLAFHNRISRGWKTHPQKLKVQMKVKAD